MRLTFRQERACEHLGEGHKQSNEQTMGTRAVRISFFTGPLRSW